MKISTAQNAAIDQFVIADIKSNGGFIETRRLFNRLLTYGELPIENGERWGYVDLLKYLAIYWHCAPRAPVEKDPSATEFMKKQLYLFNEKPKGES